MMEYTESGDGRVMMSRPEPVNGDDRGRTSCLQNRQRGSYKRRSPEWRRYGDGAWEQGEVSEAEPQPEPRHGRAQLPARQTMKLGSGRVGSGSGLRSATGTKTVRGAGFLSVSLFQSAGLSRASTSD
jgi:hypothetical protein